MTKLIATLVLLISTSSYAQSFNQAGCQLFGSVAAGSAAERLGKVPKGQTFKALEEMLPRDSDPGNAYEAFDSVFNKYKFKKTTPEKAFEIEFKHCLETGGDISKLTTPKI
jgi:hypothetical protein